MGGTRLPLGYTHFFRLIRLSIVPSHLTISPSNQTFQATSFAALMTHRTISGSLWCCSFLRTRILSQSRVRNPRDDVQTKSLLIPFPPQQPQSLLACALCFCLVFFATAPANHDRRQPSVSLRRVVSPRRPVLLHTIFVNPPVRESRNQGLLFFLLTPLG